MSTQGAMAIPVGIVKTESADTLSVAMRLRRLERLAMLMDETFQIPLLGTKVGLDALIGLVPGAGDAIAAGIAAWIVNEARLLGAPRWLLARMAWNVGVDLFGGAIPLAGDLFDIYFKCNRRNVTLLKRWLRRNGFVPNVG